MSDIADLNDWDKLGIAWATTSWVAAQYFKARHSIQKLVAMGLVETKTHEPSGKPFDTVSFQMIRLTPEGVEMQAAIEASGFNKFWTWEKRA